MEKKKIGFIGLGVMGRPMAKNLIKTGYPLVVYTRTKAKMDEFVALGAEAAENPKDLAAKSEVILLMLPDSPEVETVMLGENGVLEGVRPGSLIIDMSSITPLVDVRLEEMAKAKGVRMLDAPVSGGEPGAVAGTLAIMVGGELTVFEEAKEVLLAMGKSVVRVGGGGAGQFTKLVNQILVAIHLQAMAEALVFAKKAGLDIQKVYEAIKGGLAGSNILNAKVPMVLTRNFKPGFRVKLHLKDLKNALATGRDLGTPMPTTALVHEFFKACDVGGMGEMDHSAIITVMEELAKVEVGSA